MTNKDILNAYLKKVTEEKDSLKAEIKAFFEENKDNPNVYGLTSVTFSDRVTIFSNKYSFSYPELLGGDPINAFEAIKKTLEIYTDLLYYPDHLMEILRQNKGQTPSS